MLVLLLPIPAVWMLWHHDRQIADATPPPISAEALRTQMGAILFSERQRLAGVRASKRYPIRSAKCCARSGEPGSAKPVVSDFILDASSIYNNFNPAVFVESGPPAFPDMWLLFDLGAHGNFSGFTLAVTSQLQLLGRPNIYLQCSDDGTTFLNVSPISYIATGSGTPSCGKITMRCNPISHRYLRVQLQSSSATSPITDYQKLFDVVVYDAAGAPLSGPSKHPSEKVAVNTPSSQSAN